MEKSMETSESKPQPYMNPYLGGMGIGIVLLLAFVTMGRGLGGSSCFATAAGVTVASVAPDFAAKSSYFATYIDAHPFSEWLVWEVMGIFLGGLISGLIARRTHLTIEHGPRIGWGKRLVLAFIGGSLMAVGAKLGSGCTSGQALTGGSLLNAGSWAFMMSMFAAAYGVAYFFRKQWV